MTNPTTPHPAAETSGRTFTNDGITYCDECCNGDRCDDPTHSSRKDCRYCGGTGRIQKVTAAETSGTVEELRRLHALALAADDEMTSEFEPYEFKQDTHGEECRIGGYSPAVAEYLAYAANHALSLISQLEREKTELMEALTEAKLFMEYARYELEPKKLPFAQFPSAEECDERTKRYGDLLTRLKGGH